MDYDVIVVGGGPVGCAVARDIAAAGFKVMVAEEHSKIGLPVRCAGLISSRTLQLSRVSPRVIEHKLTGARLHAPGGEVLELYGKRVYALAVDRAAFDRDLAVQAQEAGAEIACGMRAVDIEFVHGGVLIQLRQQGSRDKTIELTSRLIVGADGYMSLVARRLGVLPKGEKVPLYGAEVELPNNEGQLADIFIGKQVAPGWFGWVMPAGQGTARVGIGAPRRPHEYFKQLANQHPDIFQGMRIIQHTSGYVPVYLQDKSYGPHSLLVGDAAGHVKPISGGGLFFGLKCAEICAATALAALDKNDFSEDFLSHYQRNWDKTVGQEIRCGLKHRQVYLNLADEDMDQMVSYFNKSHWRKIILKYGDLDYHSKLASRLANLPQWARHFFKNSVKLMAGCGMVDFFRM
jgi:digeranylgeranylglycerophospholipid reductase